jgi:hypothetical protein
VPVARIRAVLPLVFIALCACLVAGAATASAQPALVTLKLPRHATVGKKVQATGRVRGRHRSGRKVALQRRAGKKFVTLKRAKVTRGGTFTIRFRVPAAASRARAAGAHAAASSGTESYRAVVTSHGHVIGSSSVDQLDARDPTPSLDDRQPTTGLQPIPVPVPVTTPTPSLTPFQVRFTGSSSYAYDDHHVSQFNGDTLDHRETQNSSLDWATTYQNMDIPHPVTSTLSSPGLDELTGTTSRHTLDKVNSRTDTDNTCSGTDPAEAALEDNPPEVDVSTGLDAQHFTLTVEAFTSVEMSEDCGQGSRGHMEPFDNDDSSDPELAYDATAQVAYSDLDDVSSDSPLVVPVEVSHHFQNQDCSQGASGRTCSSDVTWHGTIVIRRTDGANG